MEKPTNTTKRMQERQKRGDLSTVFEGTPSMIEASEARGQQELVNSQSLPSKVSARDRAYMEKWGFKFGEPFADDPLFMPVELPEGWKKAGTDHDMWSDVEDAKGRKRVRVFYKAAFYDRRADMHLEPRYTVDYEQVGDGDDRKMTAVDNQTGEKLKSFTGPFGEVDDAVRAYLRERFGETTPGDWTE